MTLIPWMTATTNLGLPVMLAAAGGLVCEKSGTAALFLEGTMLTAAFIAVRSGGGLPGIACGILAGTLITGFHYLLVNKANVKDVIAGVGINTLALATTSFIERMSPSAESVPTILPSLGVTIAGMSIAVLIVCNQISNIRVQLEMTGESALQARIFGLDTTRIRLIAHIVAGALTGLGGGLLPLMGIGTFVDNMTNGRGYLALAAIVFGRWNIGLVLISACGFAALDALQLVGAAQGIKTDPDLLAMLPYAAGLVALILRTKKQAGPAELSHEA